MNPEIEQLRAELERLRAGFLNMRADLAAYRVVLSASFIAMSPNARAALLHNVRYLGDQLMATGLATSKSADDSTIHAAQAALDRVLEMLRDLPSS